MKVARLVGVAFAAILVLAAMTASTALAGNPEFKVLPLGPKFTSTSGLSVLKGLTTTVSCNSDETNGEITSMDTVGKVLVTYHGCTVEITGCKTAIHSPGQPAGLIQTNLIKGFLGTVKTTTESTSGVGVLFEPETAPTNKQFVTFAENQCTPESTTTGSVIGEITPLNRLSLTGKIVLQAVGSNEQRATKIVVLGSSKEAKLTAFGSTSTETSTDEIMWDGQAEIS